MTPAEVVAAWDAGRLVWTVEMGGLGPGYEQALQILVLELLRDAEPVTDGMDLTGWGEAAVQRAGPGVGGFSGAQVGAAKRLAARMLVHGYERVLAQVREKEPDRVVMVSRLWPQPPEVRS